MRSYQENDSQIDENDHHNLSSLNPLVTPGLADTSQNRCSLFEANNANTRGSNNKLRPGKINLLSQGGSHKDLMRSHKMIKLNNPYDTISI